MRNSSQKGPRAGAFLIGTAGLLLGVLSLGGWGCGRQTYPASRVKEALQEMCRKEYGIENIEVKIDGNTLGVYLPLKKLFQDDFKETLLTKSKDSAEMENLFQPSPEVLDQVEDVLFSISRVLLSTDLKIDFYLLQATDIENTGLQLVLSGYLNDIKRVRLWDVSRDEYRKRILHELRLNRAVLWHQPIRSFFQDLEAQASLVQLEDYFSMPLSVEEFQALFFFNPDERGNPNAQWELGELRSTPIEPSRILVYAPVTVNYDPRAFRPESWKIPPASSFEFFFQVSFESEPPRVVRVIPLSFMDEGGAIQKIPAPPEFDRERDFGSWETEFSVQAIHLGDFLAEQLTRRAQALLFADERIRNTFESVQISFFYQKEPHKNYFSLDLNVKLRTPTLWSEPPSALQEDILHLLNLASREFVNVLRSYRFSDYEFLQLNLASDPISRVLPREALELFRQNKIDLRGVLGGVTVTGV